MKKIKQELIDAIPVCEKGQKAIADLVKAMGCEIESKHPKIKAGQVWKTNFFMASSDSHRFIVSIDSELHAIDELGVCASGASGEKTLLKWVTNGSYIFVASSLDEYYKQKYAD